VDDDAAVGGEWVNPETSGARLNIVPFGTVHVEITFEQPTPQVTDASKAAPVVRVIPKTTALTQIVSEPAPTIFG
jgi:hypothetical protein